MNTSADNAGVARSPGPTWFRRVTGTAGAVYLAAILVGSAGSSLPDKLLPRPVRYFSQVACLFPHAATHSIDYRASAYSCDKRQFQEIDHRPYFPIRPDDKENRFYRLGHFYRQNRPVMQALEEYLVGAHNAQIRLGKDPGDGVDGQIGGIRLTSLRIELPAPGTRVERYTARPLDDYPSEWRKHWYWTPRARCTERCSQAP